MTKKQRTNLLPFDGIVKYYGQIFSNSASAHLYAKLMHDIDWRHDEAIMFGKRLQTKRKVAWYGSNPYSYTYSKIKKEALPWTEGLLKIKQRVEEVTLKNYNSCLLNLYHSGAEGMAWHSDGEKDLEKNCTIASVSFGAERKFCFKHKSSKEKIDIYLEHGSLLIMADITQSHWQHRLPPTKKIHEPRINLTFRTIVEN